MKSLTIGKLAKLTGTSADTLRYYEKLNLLTGTVRSAAGYRLYTSDAVKVIRFILGAKELGFTLDEIRKLLTLKGSDQSTCAEIMKHTETKINEAEKRIRELKEIKKVLKQLTQQCPADNTPGNECPILKHISNKE